jgi:hypothetical protein
MSYVSHMSSRNVRGKSRARIRLGWRSASRSARAYVAFIAAGRSPRI